MNNVYFAARGCLWILPPKCASTSIKQAIGLRGDHLGRVEAEEMNRSCRTIGAVRLWQDRIVSALYSVLRSGDDLAVTLRREALNSHVRPMWPAFEGLRVDHVLRVEHLEEDWAALRKWIELPGLPHVNRGRHRPDSWEDAPIDWSEFEPLYRRDLTLWSRASLLHSA